MGARKEREEAVFSRADGVRAVQLITLSGLEQAIMIAETYGLDDDPWVSRLYDCRDAVREALSPSDPASRPAAGQPSLSRSARLRLVTPG